MGFLDQPQLTEKAMLERLRFAAQQRISKERLYRLTQGMEVQTWEDHVLASLVVALEKEVYAQRHTPEHLDLDFTRPVDVHHTLRVFREIPASRRDLLLLALPRLLRWRAPRYRRAEVTVQQPVTWTDVRIQEQVVIERFWTYPDSTWAMPPDTWGTPLVYERAVPPS